jgi:hypothetical protein
MLQLLLQDRIRKWEQCWRLDFIVIVNGMKAFMIDPATL